MSEVQILHFAQALPLLETRLFDKLRKNTYCTYPTVLDFELGILQAQAELSGKLTIMIYVTFRAGSKSAITHVVSLCSVRYYDLGSVRLELSLG